MSRINLTYKNICLRALEPEDIEILYSWENNLEIWGVSNTREPFSRYILAQYIKESARDIYEVKQLRLIIEDIHKTPVGAIDLFDFDPYHLRAGIGILIHNNEDRGKGYATNAISLMCNYAKETLGLHQLYANITVENMASISLFEKAGFIKSGTKKDWIKTATGWKDEMIFQKLL